MTCSVDPIALVDVGLLDFHLINSSEILQTEDDIPLLDELMNLLTRLSPSVACGHHAQNTQN